MGTRSLVGPPELYNQTQPRRQKPPNSGDPFMDLMISNFNERAAVSSGVSAESSGDPCVDLFFLYGPKTRPKSAAKMLDLAWDQDPLTTLKLICNIREIRGNGKSDDEGFFTAAFWLHKRHPKTLAANIAYVAELGRFKDLPEILFRLLEGPRIREVQKATRRRGRGYKVKTKLSRKVRSRVPRDVRVARADERSRSDKEKASALRNEKRLAMAKKVTLRYRTDNDFRFLYDKISDCFAERLRADLESLNRGETRKISLAAKWCPSIDSSFDRSTLLCESIGRKIFPRELYEGVEEGHYAYRVRERLRKEVLVPLRKALELPEVYICANKWNEVRYHRVASKAMSFYTDKFLRHDYQRFTSYLDDVQSGKAKISGRALQPHQIIQSINSPDPDEVRVAELQWKTMVDDLSKAGKLSNCLAVVDVSTSASVSVALAVLLSELSDEPWKGKIITFSDAPTLHLIKGHDLRSKIQFLESLETGDRADFRKVFEVILQAAEDAMIKRLFVFGSTEFDRASVNPWQTEYDAIVRMFSDKGFANAVPEIVFWNLNGRCSIPAAGRQKGVALASGYSKNLLRLFINNDGDIRPETAMKAAISGFEYDKLVVVD